MSFSDYVTHMMAEEEEVVVALAGLPSGLSGDPAVVDMLKRLETTAKEHKDHLGIRLQKTGGGSAGAATATRGPKLPEKPLEALAALYGLLDRVAFGYAVLHAVAHRYYDGPQEGTTAEMAENHLRDYARVVRSLDAAISEVTVQQLGKEGGECICQCPSCGVGVCLCSPHGANTVADIWREAANAPVTKGAGGIRIRPPRRGSPADLAHLRAGDCVVAVDGRDIADESWESLKTIQEGIHGHKPGEVVRLRVRRASGSTEEVTVVR